MRTFGRPIVAAIFMLGLVSGGSAQQAMPGHDKMTPAEMHKMHKMMEHMLPNPSNEAVGQLNEGRRGGMRASCPVRTSHC